MSKLDKDQVLADFTEAYQQAHGKKPKIEAKGGWYSVDGGKNMRLAQLAEEAQTLSGDKAKPAKKENKKAETQKTETKKAAPAKKAAAPAKKPAAKAKVAKGSKGGLTAKELWRQRLEQDSSLSRLPRGYD